MGLKKPEGNNSSWNRKGGVNKARRLQTTGKGGQAVLHEGQSAALGHCSIRLAYRYDVLETWQEVF